MDNFDIIRADFQPMLRCFDWNWLEGATFFIAGASGMIPSYMVRFLIYVRNETGIKFKLVLLSKSTSKLSKIISQDINSPWIHVIENSVEGNWDYSGEITHILHAASPASPLQYVNHPIDTVHANVHGTERLLRLCQSSPHATFLYISSSEIYGYLGAADVFARESEIGSLDPMGPRACYPEAKRMGETLSMAWHKQHNIDVRIARMFHTFGPGINLHDGRAFSDFMLQAKNGCNIVLRSNGLAKRSFAYLSDTVMGLFYIFCKGKSGEAYNVGNSSEVVTISDFARIIATEACVDVEYVLHDTPESQSASVFPDTSKLESTGWSCLTSLQAAVHKTYRSIL
ncbi:MAG: NAD-dependent epimerase/dehydratase family protein [Opitutales bacterium]|nr:NAD-dependent epimerase/dehydratase family protein [Opitutales bacterium]